MKTLLFVLLLSVVTGCGTTINSTSDSQARFATHKTVAILPFEVNFDLTKFAEKKFSAKELADLKLDMSLRLQNHLYNWLRKYSFKKPFKVEIQNSYTTNEILSGKNITFSKVFDGDKTVLCKILGVDAVLTPQVIFVKPMFGDGEMQMQILINDKVSAEPLWWFKRTRENKAKDLSYTKDGKFMPMLDFSSYIPSDANNDKERVFKPIFVLIDDMMESFVDEFPYKK